MSSNDPLQIPAKKPSLVLVTHEFFPHRGGIAIFAAEMAKAAQELGYAVEIWAPALPQGATEPTWPYRVKRLPLAADHSLRSQYRMARYLWSRREYLRTATLYIAEPGPLLAMLVLQYFKEIKPARLFITLYGSELHRLASRLLLHWSTCRFFKKTTHISIISRFGQQLFTHYFPNFADKVVLTPCALRTDLITSVPDRTATDRTKTIVLTVARINPRKGQLQIIHALKALTAGQRASLEYWIVGAHSKENYDQQLEAEAAHADFPIKFLGAVPDKKLDAIYQQADIFAMTSMPHKQSVEGFGMVYLEAGAHGLPVIAHDIGGVSDAVTHGETGLLVPPGDLAALADAFAQLIDNRPLRLQMGIVGRQRAFAHTWRESAQALFGLPADLPSP